ncbi:MAG: hypothetical protein ABIZ52_03445 [Candidatus Limnocylindrales bacterium]
MRPVSQIDRAWRFSLGAVLFASWVALGEPARGGGEAGGPFMSAFSTGEAGCSGNPPLGPGDCRDWEDTLATGAASTWELDREVGLTVSGGSMAAKGVAHAVELDNADGTLGSLTFTATMEGTLTGGGNGVARIEFTANFPVASESISVVGTASVEGHGTAIIGGSGDINVTVGCAEEPALELKLQVLGGAHGGEAGRLNDDAKSQSINQTITAEAQSNGVRFCSVRVFLDGTAGTNRANPGSEHGSGKAEISLTILAGGAAAPSASPDPGECALSGIVRDGDVVLVDHENPLADIRVELLRNGAVIGSPAATGADGRYCIPWSIVPQPGPHTPEPGSYELRATLIDAAHEPPVFHTEHQDLQQPISALFDVDAGDWGVAAVELPFANTDEKPWLSDVANIHWQSSRFVNWIIETLLIPPADLAGLKVRAYDPDGTFYSVEDKVAHLSADDSPFDTRSNAASENPENGEWHEISHHLGILLGIAPFGRAAACRGRTSHGGWTNPSTCDSLGEAYAMLVPVVASLDLDAGREGGYATPDYSLFGSADDNNYRPWTSEEASTGELYYREDLGVLQLLWDLADDTPAETAITIARPRSGSSVIAVSAHDRVALGGTNLLNLLATLQPETVADLYEFVTTNAAIDPSVRTPTAEIDGDGSADLSAIDEIFLMHDVRPLGSTGTYEVGSQLGHTPPGAGNLTDRRKTVPLPGAVVQLVNTGTGRATFTIGITSESGSRSFTVRVAPGASLNLPLSLGPYWTQPLAAGAGLPACGAETARVATLAVSGPGVSNESVDACAYAHLVRAAKGGVALTVLAAGSEPLPSGAAVPGTPAPSDGSAIPVVVLVSLVVVVVLVVGGLAWFMRRRGATGAPPAR